MLDDALAFTAYVRALRSAAEPSAGVFGAAWEKLRRLLVAELRKRALWNSPPSYLGLYGYGRWSQPEVLEELLVDCFEAVLVQRVEALEGLLADESAQIDRLCLTNLRHFLHELQKRHDPLGFRAFRLVHGAIRRLVADATLYIVDGDRRVRNSTLLGFSAWTEPEAAPGTDLTRHIEAWLNDLLPDLVTAKPAELLKVEERLCCHLAGLADANVAAFRFKDVVDPIKAGVRAWRDAVWMMEEVTATSGGGDQEFVAIVQRVRPGAGYEERQFFDKLVECISDALPRAVKTKKTGAQLVRYWNFLRCQVADDRADELPSRRRIGELLEIPRTRIPEFHEILGRELERCREVCRLPLDQGDDA